LIPAAIAAATGHVLAPAGSNVTERTGLVLLEHRGASPQVHPTAYVAPTAVVCGDVRVGPHSRVLFGAVLSAEGARSISASSASSWKMPCCAAPHATCCTSVITC
jgi:hypothetical protein